MRLTSFAFVLATTLGVGTAVADSPAPFRGRTIKLPSWKPRVASALPHEPSSRLIFLHRCPEGGCVVSQGTDDSRTNKSSIAQGSRTIGRFTRSDAVWQGVVDCVRATYAPFNIGVTDVDPGPSVPHFEHIVGGQNSDLRNDIPDAGGVAPATCSEIPNAITYTFDVWGNNSEVICGVVAQETAHALGLEHELNASDPLTYLSGPYPKRFQAADAVCGEGFPGRTCECTGGMQNTYEHLLAMFGPGVPTAPSITIKSPGSGKQVQPNFITRVDAVDDVAVDFVELLVDDVVVAMSNTKPFDLVAPDGIAEGAHTIIVRGYDVQGTPGQSEPLDIVMGPPCTAASGCDGTDVCVVGVCIAGPDAPGGLGHFCQADTECISMQCQMDAASGQAYCVAPCDLSPGSCPSEFECIATGGAEGVCWPTGGGGCCDSGGHGGGGMLLGLSVLALVLRRRHR